MYFCWCLKIHLSIFRITVLTHWVFRGGFRKSILMNFQVRRFSMLMVDEGSRKVQWSHPFVLNPFSTHSFHSCIPPKCYCMFSFFQISINITSHSSWVSLRCFFPIQAAGEVPAWEVHESIGAILLQVWRQLSPIKNGDCFSWTSISFPYETLEGRRKSHDSHENTINPPHNWGNYIGFLAFQDTPWFPERVRV